MSASVSIEDVERVAELANLELTADEKPRMQRDLSAILEYVTQLNELDTLGVEPLAQISELAHTAAGDAGVATIAAHARRLEAPAVEDGRGATLRRDVPRPSLDRAEVMAQAPDTDGAFFKTPKVIER